MKDKYVALFNTWPAPAAGRRGGGGPGAGLASSGTNPPGADATATQPRSVSVSLADLGFSGPVKVRDLWNHQDLGAVDGALTQPINSHGAGFYRLHPQN